MNEYRVEYSYINSFGKRVAECEYQIDHYASKAAEAVERMYSADPTFRIEGVWISRNGRWEAAEW